MADNEEKTSEDATEEEQHEPAQPEPEPHEDHEDECDEAIAGLLAEIEQLNSRIGELESKLEQHHIEYEHTARVEPGPADGLQPTPEERHFYFRRIGH